MKLELTKLDFDQIREKMDASAKAMREARSFADVKHAFSLYDIEYKKVNSAYGRIFLRMHQDMTDMEPIRAMMEDMGNLSQCLFYSPFCSAVCESPFREQIAACYGSSIVQLMEFMSRTGEMERQKGTEPEQFDDLRQEYQMLCNDLEYIYQGEKVGSSHISQLIWTGTPEEKELAVQARTDAYLAQEEAFDSLLSRTVERAVAMRDFYGMTNYCDYAGCVNAVRFGYNSEQLAALCDRIAAQIIPEHLRFQQEHAEALSRPVPKPGDLMDGVRKTIGAVSLHALRYWDMLKQDYVDAEPSDTKVDNIALQRFVDDLGLAPIVACATDSYIDVCNLLHEFGHSLQAKTAFDVRETSVNLVASPDIMEISSQVMELLLLFHAELVFEDIETFRCKYLENIYDRVLNAAFSTEFEIFLFTHTDATPDERKEKYIELYHKYNPESKRSRRDIICELYREILFSLAHMYMFAYVLAWINAVELVKDYASEPWTFYERFRSFNADASFLPYHELMEKYGLHNVFEEDTVTLFVDWMRSLQKP